MLWKPRAKAPALWRDGTLLAFATAVFCIGTAVLFGLLSSRAVVMAGQPGTSRADLSPQQETIALAAASPATTPTEGPTPAPTPTPTSTSTPTPTHTSSATPTSTASPTPTATATATASPTPTNTPTATNTPTSTSTPIPTPDGQLRHLRVPILMYHYVSDPPEGADAVRIDLSVPPQRFEEHLRYLRAAGYTGISLFDLALALQTGAPLPERPVIVTLDDGYRDAYTQAFPLLRRYGFPATVFLITGLIDQGNPEYVTWQQVGEMAAAGMEMEAHGYTHADLRDRDADYLVWQVLGAKEAIEARTHQPVRFFCYPSGKYDELAIQVLASAHYWGAVTVNSGVDQCSSRMFELERLRVRGSHTAEDLVHMMEWLMDAPQEGEPCPSMP